MLSLLSVRREEKSPEGSMNRCYVVSLGSLFDGVVLYLEEWRVLLDMIGTKADGMHHEGAIPESASRMTMADNIVSLGHGLTGLLPSIPGTLSAL
eukprot:1537768-Amphidinium_carterae.1